MRFGVHLGLFWVSTSTRRRRRRSPSRSQTFQGIIRDEDGGEHRCPHYHRTLEAAQECARRENRKRDQAKAAAEVARTLSMSPEERRRDLEEYRRKAEADPIYRDWLRRREAETDAELQRLKAEVADIGFVCGACGNDAFEVVSGQFGKVGMMCWCTSCGTLHKATKTELEA